MIIWYLYQFRKTFENVYEQHCYSRIGVLTLLRRAEAAGIDLKDGNAVGSKQKVDDIDDDAFVEESVA